MLPPGHLAAGYLAALGASAALGRFLPELNQTNFIVLGAFMGVAPDLSMFRSLAKERKLYFEKDPRQTGSYHRHYGTHAPLIYLLLSVLIFLAGMAISSTYVMAVAVMVLAGSWSHFILDSVGYGIRWFWPFSDRIYSFYKLSEKPLMSGETFWDYWKKYLSWFVTRPEFIIELLIVIAALLVFLANMGYIF